MDGPRISWCLKQRLYTKHLQQYSSEQLAELWQIIAELFYFIMCWKVTGFYTLDTNQGHPFIAECSALTVLLAGGLALLLCAQEKKQNKIKGEEILWPTICWNRGHGHNADTNAWMHFAGVPCDPSFRGEIHWENRLFLQLQLIVPFLYYCYRINTNIASIFRLIKGSSTSL